MRKFAIGSEVIVLGNDLAGLPLFFLPRFVAGIWLFWPKPLFAQSVDHRVLCATRKTMNQRRTVLRCRDMKARIAIIMRRAAGHKIVRLAAAFQCSEKSKIGICLAGHWFSPHDEIIETPSRPELNMRARP